MGTLGTLAVSILGDSKDLDKAFDDVKKKTSDLGKSMQDMGKKVSNVGTGMTKFVTGPIVAAGAGILALAQKSADAGDEIQKMALRTGFTTEALSEYKHAAELSGTSLESLENGVKRMQRSVYDAERGLSTATDAFGAMGISISDLQGLSPEEQFEKITMALAEVEDESTRAALAQQVFGRAGTELLPMLASGAEGIAAMRQEAHDLGIVFDQEAADAAAQFNDDMLRLKKGFTGLFQELAMKLIPLFVDSFIPMLQDTVIPLVQKFTDWIAKVIEWFTNLDPVWQQIILLAVGFAAALGPVLLVIGKIITVVGTLITMLPALGTAFAVLTGPIGLIVAAIAAAIAIGWQIYNDWDEIVAYLSDLWERFSKWFSDLWSNLQDMITKAVEKIRDGIVGPFEKARDKIKSIWDGIYNSIRKILNRIIDALNKFIRAANRIKIDIPDWVPGLGGKSFGINISTIPRLHTGTDYFRPPDGADEGLAVLKRGEKVIPPGEPVGDTFNFADMFRGAVLQVRNDADIEKIARAIHDKFTSSARGRGLSTT